MGGRSNKWPPIFFVFALLFIIFYIQKIKMKLNEIIDILKTRGSADNTLLVEVAINNAIDKLELIDRWNGKEERRDFQGWKLIPQTFGDLKEFVKNNASLSDDTKLIILEDDGMGYGANNGNCTEISVSEDKDGKETIQFWF